MEIDPSAMIRFHFEYNTQNQNDVRRSKMTIVLMWTHTSHSHDQSAIKYRKNANLPSSSNIERASINQRGQ